MYLYFVIQIINIDFYRKLATLIMREISSNKKVLNSRIILFYK